MSAVRLLRAVCGGCVKLGGAACRQAQALAAAKAGGGSLAQMWNPRYQRPAHHHKR